jgi:SAM-dependent methyltransferase
VSNRSRCQGSTGDHIRRNRALWDAWAAEYVAAGERAWAQAEPAWGIWGVAESTLRVLPRDVVGQDAIELGCGTAYVSAWLARRGARVVGIDNSAAQLATARRLGERHGLAVRLIHGDAERVPCRDRGFDLAISEYGASLWCDPRRWLSEAARLVRPGGELIFLVNSPLVTLCMPAEDGAAGDRLLRPAFGMDRIEWPGEHGVEFHRSHGEWIRLLRHNGFEVEDATTRYSHVTLEWARRWPSEEVWKARRRP